MFGFSLVLFLRVELILCTPPLVFLILNFRNCPELISKHYAVSATIVGPYTPRNPSRYSTHCLKPPSFKGWCVTFYHWYLLFGTSRLRLMARSRLMLMAMLMSMVTATATATITRPRKRRRVIPVWSPPWRLYLENKWLTFWWRWWKQPSWTGRKQGGHWQWKFSLILISLGISPPILSLMTPRRDSVIILLKFWGWFRSWGWFLPPSLLPCNWSQNKGRYGTTIPFYSICRLRKSRVTGFTLVMFWNSSQNLCISPRKEKNRKPPTGENVVPREQTIKVNPDEWKQGGIPEKESPGIANPKSDPNGRHIKLVPRRPRRNSNKDPSGSNSEAPSKSKRNPQKGISFEFQSQVRSEWEPKGNKFLVAWKKISTYGSIST